MTRNSGSDRYQMCNAVGTLVALEAGCGFFHSRVAPACLLSQLLFCN